MHNSGKHPLNNKLLPYFLVMHWYKMSFRFKVYKVMLTAVPISVLYLGQVVDTANT